MQELLLAGGKAGKPSLKVELLSSAVINIPRASRPVTFYHDGFVYAYGDDSGSNFFKAFSLSSKSWISRAINNNNFLGFGGAIGNNFILGFGKNSGKDYTFSREYSIPTNTWLTPPGSAPTTGTSSAYTVYGIRLYSFGGVAGDTTGRIYDPTSRTWSAEVLPSTVGAAGNSAGTDGAQIYLFGGTTGWPITVSGKTFRRNGSGDWTPRKEMPTPVYNASQGCGVKGKIYLIGGMLSASVYSSTLQCYDPTSDKWEEYDLGRDIPANYFNGLVTDGTFLYTVDYQLNRIWKITLP